MLISLIIREMQIKILIPHTCQNACHQKDNKSWRGCRERGNSCIVGGNANWYNHYDKLWRFCKKFKKEVPHSLAISPLGIYLMKQKSERNMHPQMLLCCCSVTPSCPPLCDLMDCSIPRFHGRHQLPEFAQTHVH